MTDSSAATPSAGILGVWGARFKRHLEQARGLPNGGEDWSLWHRACAGHALSADLLVRQLTPPAHGLAMQILRRTEDAQDMVQESFLRLWTSQPCDAMGARLSTYFNTIVINRCKSHLTRSREISTENDALAVIADQHQLAQVDHGAGLLDATASQIQQALGKLLPRQRMALAMWAYADADVVQIARSLDLEVNAAHQLLYRAKAALRVALQGEKP